MTLDRAGLETMKVLIVEDDADVADSCLVLLQSLGHDAFVCVSGENAIGQIRQLRPDVLVLDMALPKVCGLDIAHELQRSPEIRPKLIIAVTGFIGADLQAMALDAGCDLFMVKPVDPAVFQRELETFKNRRRTPK
jgi:CheY-like chemotaxis protein